jgi:hypothetical protein
MAWIISRGDKSSRDPANRFKAAPVSPFGIEASNEERTAEPAAANRG